MFWRILFILMLIGCTLFFFYAQPQKYPAKVAAAHQAALVAPAKETSVPQQHKETVPEKQEKHTVKPAPAPQADYSDLNK